MNIIFLDGNEPGRNAGFSPLRRASAGGPSSGLGSVPMLSDHEPFQERWVSLLGALVVALAAVSARSADTTPAVEVNQVAVDGRIDGEKARLVIEADLKGLLGPRTKAIYGAAIQHVIQVAREKLTHTIAVQVDAVEGELKEVVLALSGAGEIRQVTSPALEDWSVRQGPDGARALVLRVKKTDPPVKTLAVQVAGETLLPGVLPHSVMPLALTAEPAALGHGYVRIDTPADLETQAVNPTGVVPLELNFLPETLRAQAPAGAPDPLAFRFQGSPYALPLNLKAADPEAARVVLDQFQLAGQLSTEQAAFTLTAVARVKNPKGDSVTLLSGNAALTEVGPSPDWSWKLEGDRFVAVFDRPGEYPLRLRFDAAVRQTNGWNELDFAVAPSALAPVVLEGLKADTEFRFAGAAQPERTGDSFQSALPPSGAVRLT